jgi:hypothetical protein
MEMLLARLKALWVRLRGYISVLLSYVEYGLSFFRSPNQIVAAWPAGEMRLGPRIAIFVHYDGAGGVGEHTLHYVRALHAAGLSVLFVTNSGRLQPAAMAALQPVCAGILIRRNIGYDFGAMREGLEYLKLPRADTELVVLANDSIYGPFRPLDDLLARIDLGVADMWGATDSWQRRYHVQSYFVAVGRKVLENPAWPAFWKQIRPVKSKTWVVNNYEVGLSQRMLRGGLRLSSVWRYHDLIRDVNPAWLMKPRKEENVKGAQSGEPMRDMRFVHAHRIRYNVVARKPLNPTSDLWRQLLRAGFPFMKRELLRDNPTEVADVTEWRDEVARHFGPVPAAIDRDLQRAMRNRVV